MIARSLFSGYRAPLSPICHDQVVKNVLAIDAFPQFLANLEKGQFLAVYPD
jgi:hypothetical protein